jgi:hypothetical protein
LRCQAVRSVLLKGNTRTRCGSISRERARCHSRLVIMSKIAVKVIDDQDAEFLMVKGFQEIQE